MARSAEHFHAFALRNRWLVLTLTALWVAVAGWLASGLKLEEDLFQALPQDKVIARYRALLQSSGNASKIAVGFTADSLQLDSAFAAADRFVSRLEADGRPVSIAVGPDMGQVEDLLNGYLERLPMMADSERTAAFAALDSAGVDSLVAKAMDKLASPTGMLSEPLVLGDPAGLLGPRLNVLKGLGGMGGLGVEGGRYVASDGRTAFVLLNPVDSIVGTPAEQQLVRDVEAAMEASKGNSTNPCLFGAVPLSMRNAERIAADSRSTTLISLVLALGLIIWYFKRATAPLLILLPPAFGAVSALAGMTIIQGKLSAISLGAGAALLGIAMAYGFHFLTHLRHNGSVVKALEETAGPLVLGCFTTVLAFLGLRLLDSKLLQDLGLLSALMLGSTAAFVILVLPLLVRDREPLHQAPVASATSTKRTIGDAVRKWAIVPVLVITGLLLPWANDATFDDEPEHLGWMPPDMRRANDLLFGNQRDTRTVFIVAEGRTEEEARATLERAGTVLRSRASDQSKALFLPTDLQPSAATTKRKLEQWITAFGNARGRSLADAFEHSGEVHGFTTDAFHGFTHWLNGMPNAAALWEPMPIPDGLPGAKVVTEADGTVLISGLLRCGPDDLAIVENVLKGSGGISVMHRGLMGERMKAVAQRDLGTTLLFTSLLVFLTLLISYGRIELALITFLPMALGWIWILGICGLFGIPFNMVNILICTFIFGLGDDYCIFTSDGILERYKTGKDHTHANRDAMLLTGVTTLLGTGALLFAEHPALRSIATLSVIGMVCILVIALTVQPWLYRTFITGRAAKGLYPFTAKSLLISIVAFLYFLLGCILLIGMFPMLRILPMERMKQRRFYGHVLMLFTRSLVYLMANVRKDIRSFRTQVEARPSIVIANHAGFIDILVMLMVHPRMLMMTNRWVWNSPFFGAVVRFMGFLRSEDDTGTNVRNAEQALRDGYSITVFPEGTRSVTGKLNRFHKGSFWLAEELKAPMVPVLLHGVGHAIQKGDWLLKDARMTMRAQPTIEWDDARYGKGHRERTKAISAEFKRAHTAHRIATETPTYWREKLVRTYIYKGPVLEWYVRVKSRIDTDLHERIHALVPRDATVVDLGCGHGMLSYLLHWSSADRRILGVDHDAAKVELAQHAFSRGEALGFVQADLTTFQPPRADVFILKDVLHYMPKEEQGALLKRCATQLNPGGIVLVRDGFADNAQGHERTRTTELFSTRLFGFNKTKGDLHFLRRPELEAMAAVCGLRCEWTGDSSVTSNELVILRPHPRPFAQGEGSDRT
ncbi:MAG: 1-acyl-sn-glycerol-3-phosphate acyltransferase [Flavobacteriales bacterium]